MAKRSNFVVDVDLHGGLHIFYIEDEMASGEQKDLKISIKEDRPLLLRN